jgi:transcriptional regulator with XRE-family HTH domain
VKTDEQVEARRLRREFGLPINEIARRVGVSKSSVSIWVRDVPLSATQIEALRQMNPAYNRQLRGATTNAERWRERRRGWQEEGRALARRGDPTHTAGVMLYWAEGDKNNRHTARLSNSDPELVRFFLDFVRATFDIPEERIRVTCYLFADHVDTQSAIEQFWLDRLELPRSCLCRSIVNVYSKHSLKRRANKLPYGTCRLSLNSVQVMQSLYGSIQEYGGFERPEWLG